MDNKPAAPVGAVARTPGKRPGGLMLWGTLGVGVLAVAGGALAWMNNTPDEDSVPVALAAAPIKPVAVAAASAESEVSTAAILEEAPVVAPVSEKLPSLKEMLAAPAKPKAGPDELMRALERPQPKAQQLAKAEHKPEHKPERKAEHKPDHKADNVKLAQKAAPAKDKPAAKQPDNDVTLITALMAHLQTRPPVKKTSTPAEQLKTCKQYNAAGEEQCRARLCAADAKKEPECKAAPGAKNASNS
ncbi:hypothetical protein RugamoR64_48360 [Duganella rhizosphaerae]|uniref:hypothetical protein n=1 Tax=Duganella rhizosphaerae TaxID=2885763 RepID=UPI0030EA39F4